MERPRPIHIPKITPRGLRRPDAAAYIGVSPTLFDSLVKEGLMPSPKKIHDASVWDVRALDDAFDSIPTKALDDPFANVSL